MRPSSRHRSLMIVTAWGLLGAGGALAAPVDVKVQSKLAGVRVPFVANEGHVDARVAYYAPTSAGTVFVTRQGQVVYALSGRTAADAPRRPEPPGWTLIETLVDGRPRPAAGRPAEARASMFLGADPARHRVDRPTYEGVSLGEVWPGVSVALSAAGPNVEKVFTVEPGSSPSLIRVRLDGAGALRVTADGALVARTGPGEATFTAPIAYQDVGGARRMVPVAYRLHGREYGFALGPYDGTRPLVIDPLLQSTFFGGGAADGGSAMAIHPTTGDVYVAGFTSSTVFPHTAGAAQATFGGGTSDAVVLRFNSALTTLIQATFLGGFVNDSANAIAIHPATGDVYVAGRTDSPNFPGTAGGAQPAIAGPSDAFVARLNSALTTLVRSTFLGGLGDDTARSLAIHPTTGEVYVAGTAGFPGTGFPGIAGGAQATFGGGFGDAFVARLTSTLTTLTQSTFFGGSLNDDANGLAIHPATGDAYAAGSSSVTIGLAKTSSVFVARFNGALTALLNSTTFGLGGIDTALAVAVHPTTGDVYTAGSSIQTVAFNTFVPRGFVVKLDGTLATRVSFILPDSTAFALAIHPTNGDVYVAGNAGAGLSGTPGGAQETFGGDTDAFVARLNRALTILTQSTFLGGSGAEAANGLAIHPATGEVYVSGGTTSPNFPGTSGGRKRRSAGRRTGSCLA